MLSLTFNGAMILCGENEQLVHVETKDLRQNHKTQTQSSNLSIDVSSWLRWAFGIGFDYIIELLNWNKHLEMSSLNLFPKCKYWQCSQFTSIVYHLRIRKMIDCYKKEIMSQNTHSLNFRRAKNKKLSFKLSKWKRYSDRLLQVLF